MTTSTLINKLTNALDEMKAFDIKVMDVRGLTSIAETMIFASGQSDRQVKALANKLIETAKEQGTIPIGVEGQQQGEWVLVDLGDIIAHIMHPTIRAYYQLESLWSPQHEKADASV